MTNLSKTLSAKLFFAKNFVKLLPKDLLRIGIVGDMGKTTTLQASQLLLGQTLINQTGHFSSLDSLIQSTLRTRPQTKRLLSELNPKTVEEANLMLSIFQPNILVVANLDYQLEDQLAKVRLVEKLPRDGALILNWENPLSVQLAEKSLATPLYYGHDSAKCHVWAENIRFKDFQTTFELNLGVERVSVTTNLLGNQQINCLLAAATLGSFLNIPLTSLKRGLEKVPVQEQEMQALEGFNGSMLIDDTYSSSWLSIESAIDSLGELPAKRRVLVLGDIKLPVDRAEKYYRQIGQKIYNNKLDLVITSPGEINQIVGELTSLGFSSERVLSNLTNPQIVNHLLKILTRGDLVLFKGAKTLRFDEVIKRLEDK